MDVILVQRRIRQMSEYVKLSVEENGVARLTLDRPEKRNALRREIIQAMLSAVNSVAADEGVRVFVLQATGKVFCAGMDLGQMQDRAQANESQDEWQKDSQVFCELLLAIHKLTIPSIAVVQGPVLAGGMGLVLSCDILVAAQSAYFMLPEPIRGITAAMVTPFLIHRVGAGPATYLLLSNERLSAVDAKAFGMCHDVVDLEQLDERVDQLLTSVLSGSPSAFSITKQHIADCMTYDLTKLVEMSISVSARARETVDAREGLAAFLEKRKPAWQRNS